MRIPRVYIDADLETAQHLVLPQKQSNYLCKALRMAEGRSLWLFNGKGGAYRAEIILASPKKAEVKILDFDSENRESILRIELAVALSKGDRFDFVLQKATELGVAQIQPLLTERTDVKLSSERLKKKHDHWRGILLSACEQSGRNLVPAISEALRLENYLRIPSNLPGLTLDPSSAQKLTSFDRPEKGIRLLIGPEGGLTEEEILGAQNAGFESVSLGPRVLRTETAPLAAMSIAQALWGDL